jgi:predicted TPR repeat methyltransferase
MNSLVKHYDSTAVNFNKFWVYSEEFVLSIVKDIEQSLDFQAGDTFVDIGSGTGIYTTRLIERSKFKFSTICVDISAEMLKQIPIKEPILKLQKSASDFSKSGVRFDKGLLKEVLHHIDNKEEAISNLCENLNEKGIILFIISPVLVEYPLFRKALELRQNTKSSEPMIVDLMRRQGLEVTVSTHSYPVNLNTDRFIDMVKGRYLSFLSKFSDNELEKGVREMQNKLVSSTVSFVENYIFIKGVKVHSL